MTVKEQAHRAIEVLPESATWEDVLYSLYVCHSIARGMDDVDKGRTISDKDVRREFLK